MSMYGKRAQGAEHYLAKLDDATVRKIREQHARKERIKKKLDARYGAAALALRYGVHVNTITKVLLYSTWRHVK